MITIEQIKAECRKAIELSANATAGPWESSGKWGDVNDKNGDQIFDSMENGRGQKATKANAHFAAHARTFSPVAARVVLDRIKDLEEHGTPMDIAYQYPKIIAAWEGRS